MSRRPLDQNETFHLIDLMCQIMDQEPARINGERFFSLFRLYLLFFFKNNQNTIHSNWSSILSVITNNQKTRSENHEIEQIQTTKESRTLDNKKLTALFLRDEVGEYVCPFSGVIFDRFCDPIIELLPSEYSYKKLSLYEIPTSRLEKFYYRNLILPHGRKADETLKFEVRHIQEAFKVLNRLLALFDSTIYLDPNHFTAALRMRLNIASYFYGLLKELNPAFLVVRCYYSPRVIGLCYAANLLGIRVVDCQHGPYGNSHSAYIGWPTLSSFEACFLPTDYFHWDELSAQKLQARDTRSYNSNSWILGDLWPKFIRQRSKVNTQSLFKTDRPLVLVALGYSNNIFPSYVFDFLRYLTKDHFLMIRSHPADDTNYKNEFMKLFGTRDKESCEYKLSSRLPLPILLEISTFTICHNSGVMLESLEAGVPVVTSYSSYTSNLPEGSSLRERVMPVPSCEFEKVINKINQLRKASGPPRLQSSKHNLEEFLRSLEIDTCVNLL